MRKKASVVFCVFFIVLVLCSVAFLATEADHDCDDAHCPVCSLLRFVKGVTKLAVNVVFFVCFIPFISEFVRVLRERTSFGGSFSLIRSKVKLSF